MKKVFFGWYIMAATLLLLTYNSVVFVYGFTAFMSPIIKSLGYTSAQVSLASSIRGLEVGGLDPFVGAAADRWSSKRLMLIGIIIFALGIICISQSTNLAVFYAGFLIVGLGGSICITVVPNTVIARWFRTNIGKASGIMATGVATGGMFTPLVVKAIDAFGWQNTLLYMAIGMLVVGIPLSFLFRSRPEVYGMSPDGKAQTNTGDVIIEDSGVSVKEALKMRAFWFIAIGTMLLMMPMHALTIHMMPHLESIGIERDWAALSVTIFAIITVPSRLLYGVAADIYPKKYILIFSMILTVAGLMIFHFLDGSSFAMVVLFAVIYGIGAAGVTPLRTPILRDYFGIRRFGTIFGLNAFFITVGAVIGAPLAGWVYDMREVYDPIWLIFTGIVVVGMILIILLPSHPGIKTSAPNPASQLNRFRRNRKENHNIDA